MTRKTTWLRAGRYLPPSTWVEDKEHFRDALHATSEGCGDGEASFDEEGFDIGQSRCGMWSPAVLNSLSSLG